jgi:hypothetical protein
MTIVYTTLKEETSTAIAAAANNGYISLVDSSGAAKATTSITATKQGTKVHLETSTPLESTETFIVAGVKVFNSLGEPLLEETVLPSELPIDGVYVPHPKIFHNTPFTLQGFYIE